MMSRLFFFSLLLSFNTYANIKFDANVPAKIITQFNSDLKILSEIKLDNSTLLNTEIFGVNKSALFYDFFTKRISKVGAEDFGMAVAFVNLWGEQNKMYVTNNFINFSHPQIARIMILVHESRHAEKPGWMHIYCPVPFLDKKGQEIKSIWTGATLSDELACDDSVYGAYGISSIMLGNISKFCTNCNEKMKLDAEIYSDDQQKRITSDEELLKIKKDLELK